MIPHQSTTKFVTLFHVVFILIIIIQTTNCEILTEVDTEQTNDQEIKSPVQRIFDPHSSWLAFVKNANRPTNRRKIKSGGGNKKQGTLPIPATPCPRGPQGPAGPPGPPGANVTMEVLLNEFRELIKEVAEKRIESFLDPSMPPDGIVLDDVDKKRSDGVYVPPLFDLDNAVILPKVTDGFFGRLAEPVVVQKKSLRELKEFHVPFGDGAFQRGDENGAALNEGQYTIIRTGIYHVSVNLHFRMKRKKPDSNKKGALHVLVCIDSLCQTNVALESIMSADQLGQHFSLSVAGFLHLQKGQFISVMIDNDTRSSLSIQPSSYFSAILSGL